MAIFLSVVLLIDGIFMGRVDLHPRLNELGETLFQSIFYEKFLERRVEKLDSLIREKNPYILILGSSRSLMGISPQILSKGLSLPEDSAINFSLPAESIQDILYILQHYEDELKNLRLVIIEMAPFQFTYSYSPFIKYKGGFKKILTMSLKYKCFEDLPQKIIPSYRKRKVIEGHLLRTIEKLTRGLFQKNPRVLGIHRRVSPPDFRPANMGWIVARGRKKDLTKPIFLKEEIFQKNSIPEQELKNLKNLYEFLIEKNFQVIFIEMPVREEFEELLSEEYSSLYSFFNTNVKSFLKREKNFPFIEGSFTGWVDEKHFYDFNHLNEKGAIYFTEKLVKWINEME